MNWLELKEIFNDCEIIGEKLIIKSDLLKLIDFIKQKYHFTVLKSITAIDNQEEGIELVYRVYDVDDEEELVISQTVFNNEAESISSVFDSAVADEREIYDLFGVKFIGNQELKRLYLPESWEGHPLKKDYQEKDERLNWNDEA